MNGVGRHALVFVCGVKMRIVAVSLEMMYNNSENVIKPDHFSKFHTSSN